MLLFAGNSCSVLQQTRITRTVKTKVMNIKPVVSDLQIDEIKKTGIATDISDVPIEKLKKEALIDMLQQNYGDVVIAPFYVIKKELLSTTVTVHGYIGKYINIRQDTTYVKSISNTSINDNKVKVIYPEIKVNQQTEDDNEISVIGVSSLNENMIIPLSKKTNEEQTTPEISGDTITLEILSKPDLLNISDSIIVYDTIKVDQDNIILQKNNTGETESIKSNQKPDQLINSKILTPEIDKKTEFDSILIDVDSILADTVMVVEISKMDIKEEKSAENTTLLGNKTEVNKNQTSTTSPPKNIPEKATGTVLMLDKNKFVGNVKSGKPHGIGTIYYNTKTKISAIDNVDVYARKGDFLQGRWFNGELEYGILYDSDGEVVSKITVGR